MPQDLFREDALARPTLEIPRRALIRAFDLTPPPSLFARVAVGLDGSPGSFSALAWAGRLASDGSAQVVVAGVRVPVFAPASDGGPGWWTREPETELAESLQRVAMEEALVELRGIGVRASLHGATGAPAPEILRAVALHGADLVAVGASRRPDLGPRLGRVAERLLAEAPVAVLLARGQPGGGPVVAAGEAVVPLATRLARKTGAAVMACSPGEAVERAREARATLLVVPRDEEGMRLARNAPCSVLVAAP